MELKDESNFLTLSPLAILVIVKNFTLLCLCWDFHCRQLTQLNVLLVRVPSYRVPEMGIGDSVNWEQSRRNLNAEAEMDVAEKEPKEGIQRFSGTHGHYSEERGSEGVYANDNNHYSNAENREMSRMKIAIC